MRPPAVAGQFYPRDPKTLREHLHRLRPDSVDKIPDLLGILSPHAGYEYSGSIAALAHATLAQSHPSIDGIIILGPSHFVPFRGISIPEADGYATPLGEVPLPEDVASRLEASSPLVMRSDVPHAREHSVEVQYPFVQYFYHPIPPILPIVVGSLMHEDLEELADVLAPLVDRWNVVVSSDLYHGYSVVEGERRDAQTLEAIAQSNAHDFLEKMLSGEIMACGGMAIALMKAVLEKQGYGTFQVLAYTNSARIMGRSGGYVVGYAAGVWRKG